ncbi:hypothetical protein J2125_003297 [Erwinia toletana]|uniref:DUF4810 domain-containing protein n=1 Tax=Winslowiella toletana TaxID=92490 RepID=A0ABS4PBT3_9GAMM|nr:DUF4810 domain-containing protein [Winslowiella toletana]MBP2170105.1 hypothetical protein [Winslowiella toletana]
MRILKYSLAAATALLLTACAEKNTNIYYWGDYQPSLYSYYKHTAAPEKEIETLNAVIQQANAKNKPVAPGLRAQLGLLYVNTGHPDLAFSQFNAEKAAFPESSHYMDFLMRNKQEAK